MDGDAPPGITTIVIGDSPFRSESLAHTKSLSITNVPAVRVKSDDLHMYADQELAELLYGRCLTAGEVGCALAHRTAYSIAQDSPNDWALILEDDASVPDDFLQVLSSVPLRDLPRRPSIVSLFSYTFVPRPSGRSESDSLRKLWVSPSTTTAYLINRDAWSRALAAPSTVVATADWPPWSMTVDFYCLRSESGVHPVGDSTIPDRASQMSLSRVERAARALSGKTGRSTRAYFRSREELFKWYAVSPIRRMLGRSSAR